MTTGFSTGRALRPTTKVLPEHARGHNRSLVLQTLYRAGQQSRADIARETGLTRVTVSDLVAELIVEGLIIETGQREDVRPGKPATLLDLNRGAFQIIGIDLSEYATFRGAVLDLDGQILHRIIRQHGMKRAARFIDDVTKLSIRGIMLEGFSFGIDDEDLTRTEYGQIDEALKGAVGDVDRRIKIFKEGQLVHSGELLAQIDPRPFEVQLIQAEGQMARDQAQMKNAQLDLERYRDLYKQNFIPKQQLDTQEALLRAQQTPRAKKQKHYTDEHRRDNP